MNGFEEEPVIHRQGAMEINTFVDFDDIYQRQRVATDTGMVPFYMASTRPGLFNITYGEVVHRRKGAALGDNRVTGSSGLCGAGAEAQALYPDNPDMVKACIKAQYDILGLACGEYNHSTDAQDQGFVTAVSGLHTTAKSVNKIYEPGQILRAELPDEDVTLINKMNADGKPLAKYQWRVVPEDYNTPGDNLLLHINAINEDDQRWRQALGPQRNLDIDKWLATNKAEGDSAIMSGLLTIYVLMKMGYLVSAVPAGANPYLLPTKNKVAPSGDIGNAMPAHEFVVRMAELLSVQPYSGSSSLPNNQEQVFFDTLRRILMSTIFYNGKSRPFEFGQKQGVGANALPTRDSRTGAVELGTKEGLFLHNQLNHIRRRMGTTLQALDDHTRFRIGRVMSGPNRTKRINVSIERQWM